MKNTEIERKFLVDREKWSASSRPAAVRYLQGYLVADAQKVVRARVAGDRGFITIKGRSDTLVRPEYEYAIPAEDAEELIRNYAVSRIEKTRTKIPFGSHVWEVDEFLGENTGLLLAEIELTSPEEGFEKPEWAGEEVTGDPRYYNSYLSVKPYGTWKRNEQ